MTFSTTNGWSAASLARPWLEDSAAKDTANRLLEDIQELAPCVQSRSGEMEGSNAVYESSALQLRLRDLLVGSQHFVAQKRQYVTSGKLPLETHLA